MKTFKACAAMLVAGLSAGAFVPDAAIGQNNEVEAMRHRQALTLFEGACLDQAPDFGATRIVFETMGLLRPPDKATYRHPALGLYGGILPVQAGSALGQQCSVLMDDGKLPILVIGMRTALARYSEQGTLFESPPQRATDPVLWTFRLPEIGAVSVTAGMGREGVAILGMQVADRGARAEASQ